MESLKEMLISRGLLSEETKEHWAKNTLSEEELKARAEGVKANMTPEHKARKAAVQKATYERNFAESKELGLPSRDYVWKAKKLAEKSQSLEAARAEMSPAELKDSAAKELKEHTDKRDLKSFYQRLRRAEYTPEQWNVEVAK